MILIHTALYCEANPIIEHLKLKQFQTKPYKIYKNEKIILVISGIGKLNTLNTLEDIFTKYSFSKVFNIGIAGCKDVSIKIGSFFDCSSEDILTTLDEPLEDKAKLSTLLVDMEAKYFKDMAKKNIQKDKAYVFKIVSDHLSTNIPKKSFVSALINDSLDKWIELVN